MQKVLMKRVVRDLKTNWVRYLALAALIILGMYLIVAMVAAAETIIHGTETKQAENRLEDGEFEVFLPLEERQEQELTAKGIILERMFYLDFSAEDGSVLRVFENRQEVNRIELDEGRLAETAEEIVLEKRYCEEHSIMPEDVIRLAEKSYQVVGIGSVPDYDAVYKNLSDSSVDSESFGLAFLSREGYEAIKNTGKSQKSEAYQYAYRLNGVMTDKELKAYLQECSVSVPGMGELNNLTAFVKAEDNRRIGAGAEDQVINRLCALVAGVIVMILFTYVISVFVIHSIDKESGVIGALYALGVKRRTLMLHYLMLPSVITFLAGCIGTTLGFSEWGIKYQMKESYLYFSIPEFAVYYPGYLIVYSLVMPVLVAIVVNCAVIRKRLSRPVLALIRNEQKSSKVHNLKLGKLGFVKTFQIRQLLREGRSSLTVVFGMFISLLIMMLGVNCYVLCGHVSTENKADTKYEYMYTCKYPLEGIPQGGEPCLAKTLKKEVMGYKLEVTLLGIRVENPYFDAEVQPGMEEVIISSAMAQKYQLEVGDKVTLNDEEEVEYTFTVAGITQYSVGFYVFMELDSARELLGKAAEDYNVLMSDIPLDIDADYLYATLTKTDVEKASDVFIDMMMPMVKMMCGIAAIIFCVVMYLMMKVMIDRSSFHISLMKIFGYRNKEVRKLYLNGNFYIVAVGAAVCIPIAKWLMDRIHPYMVSNVACGINLKFDMWLYMVIYLAVILCYLVINHLLVGRLKKLMPAEVLKNRE